MFPERIYFFRGRHQMKAEWQDIPANEPNNLLLNLVLHTRFIGKICLRMIEWKRRAITWPSSVRSKKLTKQLEKKLNAPPYI